MRQFFLTIILVSVALILLLIYYAFKHHFNLRRTKQRAENTWQKLYEDEKVYTRTRIRSLLSELESGKIQWIILHSKTKPDARFELTFSSLRKVIHIIFNSRVLSEKEKNTVQQMGADGYSHQDENNIIQCSSNSKIICDIVFYLMTEIYDLLKAKNLNIKISGRV